jgi:hypothetical protein
MKPTFFSALPIDAEFYWGAYQAENMNWGKKRSTRTAFWKPRILGKLSNHTSSGYFGQNERVYIK